MIHFQILRDIWAWMSVLTGLALVFFVAVTYFDMKRPRVIGKHELERSDAPFRAIWQTIPWSLKIGCAVLLLWEICYGIFLVFNPPNW